MGTKKFISLLAYIAVILISLATVFGYLSQRVFNMSSNIASICNMVAYYLAMLVTFSCAFKYAVSKRNTIFILLLIIAVILFIVFTFVL